MSEQVSINDGKDVIEWDGPGWYADRGRWDTEGKSFTQGVKIASFAEYREDGFTATDDDAMPYVWDYARSIERGTPYKLTEKPETSAQ